MNLEEAIIKKKEKFGDLLKSKTKNGKISQEFVDACDSTASYLSLWEQVAKDLPGEKKIITTKEGTTVGNSKHFLCQLLLKQSLYEAERLELISNSCSEVHSLTDSSIHKPSEGEGGGKS